MFSSLRASTWSLSARLLVGQVCLLLVVCLGIGAVTVLALHQYLIGEVDNQLRETAHRSAIIYGQPPPPPLPPFERDNRPPWPRPGPGPEFLDAPGQPVGMVAAVITNGTVSDAGLLGPGGERASLSPKATAQLAEYRGLRHEVTRDLDGLGTYRVIAVRSRLTGETLVIGLSMGNVEATLWRVALIFAVVTAVALAVATTVGIWINRRALAPLTRVVATAGEVANLPLDRGEVQLPVRVSEPDANPYTEVGRLGLALNRMLDHISTALSTRQASESRVRQFVADASHELRTPLAAIRGYTELAQRKRDQVPDDVAHAMGRVESEAVRMTHLVEDLLLLARLDSGRPLESEPVDLSRLSADVASDAHVAGPDHQWNLDVPTDPLYVTGDDARLHQVVANLLANARTHTPPGTSVTLSLHAESDAAVLRVADDGPGIPSELQSEVFERFARGDTSRSRKGGSTGLGLAIASAVVRAHSGSIELRSVPGRTEFTVRLPRAVES
ncbi:sensor histidine kinase [Mycolicibacterium sphagni]|uniref:histidine kinase n=1 Tax=Mycolicibacterium sphagni TaxID=1786 RepID=A0ABX2JVF3_9MYCO|nr:HAMP domain-containing sensor histidine kinase [Mycolicibacterium sphagni]NTY59789.1 HAMP domain-containing histidine kinase [Mycolicibacterium sphagni]